MKRILSFITVFTLLLTACEGPQGPPGFDGFNGRDGQDGLDGVGVPPAYEIILDFIPEDNYEWIEPYGFEVLPTEVTLVYIRWETLEDGTEVWRQLPQNFIFEDGTILTYNFDFTQLDVRFFLDGNADFDALDSSFTLEQVFRVVVIPANNVGRLDLSNLDNVMSTFGIEEFEKRQY